MLKNIGEENLKTIISESLIEKLKNEKNQFIPARTATLPKGVTENILKDIQKTYELKDRDEAIAILALLFQQGGTSRSCDGNMRIVLFGKTCKLAEIRNILKQNSCNKAERKLARTLANEIKEVAKVLEIPGNLYNKIQKLNLNKEFTLEEKVWLSDFQSDNKSCPIELKQLILETFRTSGEKKSRKGKKK
jgi:hypothetical protein